MALLDRELIQDIVLKNARADERKFDEYRNITIERGFIEKAEGSAKVTMGDTTVVAGVKMEPGEPFEDNPDEGMLMVNAEFLPLASPEFEPGPPSEFAVEVARLVDRMIRESKSVDMKKLFIKDGQVWKLMIDVVILDHDGNLLDACALAATAALMEAKIPNAEVTEEQVAVDYYTKGSVPVPLLRKPVSVTVSKIANKLLVDLTHAEESAMDARLPIGLFIENGQTYFCSMQKGGSGGFTYEEFERALDIVEAKGKELLELLE
jgi:exosome complex component RRP42